ncbi:MAG TPA: hypothetical protein VIU85_03310, partial [Chthoniobacterales bacterium]
NDFSRWHTKISRARIRMKAVHSFSVNVRTNINSKKFSAFRVAPMKEALLRIATAKDELEIFFADIAVNPWRGVDA